jgi:hypothetical protein
LALPFECFTDFISFRANSKAATLPKALQVVVLSKEDTLHKVVLVVLHLRPEMLASTSNYFNPLFKRKASRTSILRAHRSLIRLPTALHSRWLSSLLNGESTLR